MPRQAPVPVLVNAMDHNPMQTVIRRQMGIDAFGLDGDDTPLWDSWADRPRAVDPLFGRPPQR